MNSRTHWMTTMLTVTLISSWVTQSIVTPAHAQTKARVNPEPRFEVASVKLNLGSGASEPKLSGEQLGRVVLLHIPLKGLILGAYDLQANRLVGPEWLDKTL